jgi:hypothetical protein
MLIYTTIPPRRDGRVFADCGDTKYVFSDNGNGDLVCDISNDEHATELVGRSGALFVMAVAEGGGDVAEDCSDGQGSDDGETQAAQDEPSASGGEPAKKRRGRPPKTAYAQSDLPDGDEEQQ